MKNEKMNQFQGLRALAIIAIFISHTWLGPFGALGAFGVSIFFVLSGFLMMYNYYPRENDPKFGLAFVWKKVKKLYPLHIVFMLVGLFYCLLSDPQSIGGALKAIPFHVLLVQVWIPYPKIYATLNGVSWYLSASAFLYFCFPIILKIFKKFSIKKTHIYRIFFISIVLEVIISYISYQYLNIDKNSPFSVQWLTYYFPLTRLIDFIVGCSLGYLFLIKPTSNKNKLYFYFNELLIVIFIALALLIYWSGKTIFGTEYIKYTLLFLPITISLIWFVANNQGFYKLLLETKLLVQIGNDSPYIFLIHLQVIKFSLAFFNKVLSYISNYIVIFIAIIATYVFVLLWKKICSINIKLFAN